MENKIKRRIVRKRKIKSKIISDSKIPRLCVFRSNKYIYAQIINNISGDILTSASDKELTKRGKKIDNAAELGKIIAQKALQKKIKQVVFDRSGYPYHGRVKSLAEAARGEGLIF